MVDVSLAAVLQELASEDPDRVAVDTGHERVTYASLQRRASQVAREVLNRHTGDAPVALVVAHGLAPILATLGVLYAGRIAAPVDAREPEPRLAQIIDATRASLVVTGAEHADLARRVAGGRPILELDEATGQGDDAPLEVGIDATTPGLLLFTSGSTGVPKGVLDAHANIVANARRFGRCGQFVTADRVALTTSFGFTATYTRLFGALVNGATVCPYDLRRHGVRALPQWVDEHRITTLFLVPSMLRLLTAASLSVPMTSVRLVTLAGETLYGRDVARAREHFDPSTVFLNRLGATEADVIDGYVVTGDEDDDAPLPVGHADRDDDGEAVELRVEGEPTRLVIVARHLTLGYWNDRELTDASYAREPDGRRAFRTSDLVRLRNDGTVEHVGRLDSRVKVRGAMVATAEVEQAILADPDLAEAAVVGAPAKDGGTRLVAYVVPKPLTLTSERRVRRAVALRLPSTMIPGTVVVLDALPRTARGKVDRQALPPPEAPVPTLTRDPVGDESALVDLFADILVLDQVGVDDDFFDLGGDSLGVIELLAAIEQRLGIALLASDVVEAPTVALLAHRLTRARTRNASIVVPLRAAGDGVPFFCVTGGGSSVMTLRPLADAIGGRCFGIQARGLEERALPDRTVEAAARRAVAALRAVEPSGPYRLGGFSFGGLVAFEMACRLVAAGEEVELLALLDTPAPGLMARGHTPLATRAMRFRDTARAEHAHQLMERLDAAVRFRAAKVATALSVSTAGLYPRKARGQYELFLELSMRMARRYHPIRTFSGRAVVVRASESPRNLDYASDLGWTAWVRGTLTVCDVPCDHRGLIRKPAVTTVGALLSTAGSGEAPCPDLEGLRTLDTDG